LDSPLLDRKRPGKKILQIFLFSLKKQSIILMFLNIFFFQKNFVVECVNFIFDYPDQKV